MKILYDYQAFDMQTHGGVSRCFAELYTHRPSSVQAEVGVVETDNVYLQQLGFPAAGNTYRHFMGGGQFPLKRMLFKACVNIRKGYPSRWDKWPRLNQMESERLLKTGDFDVFHPTFYDDYFLHLLAGKPFVLTIHDMIPELFPQYYPKDNEQILLKRKLVSRASHIVAVSEQTRRDVIRLLNVPEDRITVVYHGADDAPYTPSPDNRRDYEYILFVGERHLYKNFMAFCRDSMPILRRHPDLKVVCTGKPFTEEELNYFDSLGMRERFVHAFMQTTQNMLDLYHYAVAFVYPSAYEGFGIPILEAYKADCPVMLNRTSCFPEIAGDAAVYFTMRDDASDFEEQFETLYHLDGNARQTLLAKQQKRLQHFSWDASARQLAAVYENLMKGLL